MEFDEEEIMHSDFNNHVVVSMLPDFSGPINWPGFYEQSVSLQATCRRNLDVAVKAYKSPPEALGE